MLQHLPFFPQASGVKQLRGAQVRSEGKPFEGSSPVPVQAARGRSLRGKCACLLLLLPVFFANRTSAFEETGHLDGIDYRFICTDVAQLKENINVLVILSRRPGTAGEKKTVRVALDVPAEAFESAAGNESLEAIRELAPGDRVRFAFRGLLALEGTEPGSYPFELRISAGEDVPEVSRFEVATLRGPLPPRGILSILYPTLVSLLFLPVFILFLQRWGEPGGWRTVKDAELDEPEDAWWEPQEPRDATRGKEAS